MKKKDKLAIAIIGGMVIAGAVTYLFTSDKGKSLRKKAKEKGQGLVHDLERIVSDLKCKQEKKETVS